jgi:hypothetical protein
LLAKWWWAGALTCLVELCWPLAGIMLFRKKALPFVDEWIRVIESDDKIWDQNAFNDLARKGQQILPDDPNHYFKGACVFCSCVWLWQRTHESGRL